MVRLQTECRNEMVERGSRRNGLAGGRGQHLWKKLPGEGELLDFFPWDEKRVPCMVWENSDGN